MTELLPQAGSLWKHRKGGVYEIVCNAKREGDCWPVVVYRSTKADVIWVRPLDEFMDGRFTPVDPQTAAPNLQVANQ